jgi:hypothetical protein
MADEIDDSTGNVNNLGAMLRLVYRPDTSFTLVRRHR